ncbi:response regulator [Cellulomonas sp. H30R-01]|uniref:hybrid sensor histidine kinase/response regulator n=1 Tax=Cellulomonas sp. H30R-01 TaxID=2704467 RepID=UPI00138B1FBF|nr:hybrid sensor histidine kinase/response regulator [Cellulomonas sp. H30R-01]QHT56107.1 response regulator [Cellulomonas sp. H30R-01]
MTSGPTVRRLGAVDLVTDGDVVLLRQVGREAGGLLGLDGQDQVRLATALSEVGREVVGGEGGRAVLEVGGSSTAPELVVRVSGRPARRDARGDVTGVAAAQRLVDGVDVAAEVDGTRVVVLRKVLPDARALSPARLDDVRASLSRPRAADALDELRVQNTELVRALEALAAREQDLVRANEELEETNRGVMAMYSQLSDELEETNSGVVALYAELDERGRQLAAANDAKTRFLRSVSHELRAPVNSILGLASLLADGTLDEDQRIQVGYLDSSARALLGMVNELLDLARAESGRQHVHRARVDLAVLLADLEGTVRPLLRPGVGMRLDVPSGVELHTDAELLGRVLRNLLTNAAKFTDAGSVDVAVAVPEDGVVVVTVRDTGIGIPAEHLDTVFEEFFQVPNRLQPSAKGTGLGLPYARRVAEALGGSLDVASVVGEGSTFTLTLERTTAPTLGRVLVVDDDDAARAVVRGLLAPSAAEVVEARDGAEALDVLAAGAADVVLMDVRMPGVDGVTALHALRSDARWGTLPVVLMSTLDEPPVTDVPFVAKAALDADGLTEVLARAAGTRVEP